MTATIALSTGPLAAGRFSELRQRYRCWVEGRREIRRIETELRTMTPRELADIGLNRSDIPDVARGRI